MTSESLVIRNALFMFVLFVLAIAIEVSCGDNLETQPATNERPHEDFEIDTRWNRLASVSP